MKKEHPDWDSDKCAAVCHSIWRRKHKGEKMDDDRVLLHLGAMGLNTFQEIINESGETKTGIQRTTMLVGDKTYNGIYFSKKEIEKSVLKWNTMPFMYDHSSSVYDMIGELKETQFQKSTGKLSTVPVVEGYPLSESAMQSIDTIQSKGRVPNVSVGVYASRKWLSDKEIEEGKYPKGTYAVAEDLEPDHLALVIHGACSPEDGCGVGLRNDSATISLIDNEYVESDEIEKLKLQIKIKELELEEEK